MSNSDPAPIPTPTPGSDPMPDEPARHGTEGLAESLNDEDADVRAGTWADESPENRDKPEE